MPTEEQILESLKEVLVPGSMRSVAALNLLRNLDVSDGSVKLKLASAAINMQTQQWLKMKLLEVLSKTPGINDLEIEFIDVKPADVNKIKYIIAIMSGKGGVGKSLVTSLLATALTRQGFEVGILDADITGPSIPKMFGATISPAGSDTGLLPVLSRTGISIMSINLLLPHEDDAVIWRGPLIGNTIKQFYEDVLWGRLDYLLIDLPPGTADAPLTVMQSFPISGVIIVFTPQELTAMVVKKAVKMAQQMNKPILGVIENMSYLYVPEIDKKIELFGKSRGEEMARVANAPLLGQLPVDSSLAKLCDEGDIERYDGEIMAKLSQSLSQAVPVRTD